MKEILFIDEADEAEHLEYCKFMDNFVGPRLSIFKMTEEERARIRDLNPPIVTCLHSTRLYFDWGWKACGYGQLSFDLENGKITCANEAMSKEAVRTLMRAYVDYLVDNSEFDS